MHTHTKEKKILTFLLKNMFLSIIFSCTCLCICLCECAYTVYIEARREYWGHLPALPILILLGSYLTQTGNKQVPAICCLLILQRYGYRHFQMIWSLIHGSWDLISGPYDFWVSALHHSAIFLGSQTHFFKKVLTDHKTDYLCKTYAMYPGLLRGNIRPE